VLQCDSRRKNLRLRIVGYAHHELTAARQIDERQPAMPKRDAIGDISAFAIGPAMGHDSHIALSVAWSRASPVAFVSPHMPHIPPAPILQRIGRKYSFQSTPV